MNRDEMDDAIRETVGDHEMCNVRSIAFKRWRRIYIAGMRAAVSVANGERLTDGLRNDSDKAYERAITHVVTALGQQADELARATGSAP